MAKELEVQALRREKETLLVENEALRQIQLEEGAEEDGVLQELQRRLNSAVEAEIRAKRDAVEQRAQNETLREALERVKE